jgi:nuclear transcription factor Y alpha
MRRPRGPGGRFLTAAEVEAMETNKDGSKEEDRSQETLKGMSSAARGSGTKLKPDTDTSGSSKRARENPLQAAGWK